MVEPRQSVGFARAACFPAARAPAFAVQFFHYPSVCHVSP
jgi:hypothetical protein